VAARSELEATVGRISVDVDELVPLLEAETPDDVTVELIERGDTKAIACLSERDGLVLHVFDGANIETERLGHLPGAVITERRHVVRDAMSHAPLLHVEAFVVEHPRLKERIRWDASGLGPERVAQVRKALISVTKPRGETG
jgi:hypothetical protein